MSEKRATEIMTALRSIRQARTEKERELAELLEQEQALLAEGRSFRKPKFEYTWGKWPLGTRVVHCGSSTGKSFDMLAAEHYEDSDEAHDGQFAGLYTRLRRVPCAPPCKYAKERAA